MASHQLMAGMPPVTLDYGCTVTVEAIDPDTGAAVTGVQISSFAIGAGASPPRAAVEEVMPEYIWGVE